MTQKEKICPNGFHSNGNPGCSCGEKKEDWEKEVSQHGQIIFYLGEMDARDRYPIAEKELIDYISSILLSQKQELREKMEGMRKDVRPEVTVWLWGNRETNEAYNRALDDILKLL